MPLFTSPRSLLPSLFDLAFVKVAANLERLPEMRVPFAVKKKMLDFVIRTKNGRVPRNLLDRLLDPNLAELDLLSCELSDADHQQILSTCTRLKSLTLGSTTDVIIKLVAQVRLLLFPSLSTKYIVFCSFFVSFISHPCPYNSLYVFSLIIFFAVFCFASLLTPSSTIARWSSSPCTARRR